jgi:hypothetical protein
MASKMARMIRKKSEFASILIIFNSALFNIALILDIEKESLGRYIVKLDEELSLMELALVFD